MSKTRGIGPFLWQWWSLCSARHDDANCAACRAGRWVYVGPGSRHYRSER